jgi:alginate O-acetyltransferase complex protein AlgI
MVFTSHIFIFYFLPLVLLTYHALPRKRNLLLLLMSYVFYGWEEPWFMLLMLAATMVNFIGGRIIASAPRRSPRARAALALSVIASLGLLGFFKYYMFALGNINRVLEAIGAGSIPILEVTLPIGISFYVFQSLSYSADVYRGVSQPVRSFWDFACYVSLFPQLIAGPIVRYNTIADQLVHREHRPDRFASGVALFILGFSKKILLANPMGEIADATFGAASLYALDAWVGVLAYSFQIYFDFAGYSDMAVGLGRMFGFEFPRNFNAPYRSVSITDFWRRWHISLSTFLRDYLYIPLGGNRLGPGRTYVNLAVVMLLGGLWHGANWTFIAWGALHGTMLITERLRGKSSLYGAWPWPIQVLLTFVLVQVSWVLFRCNTIGQAFTYLGAMFDLSGHSVASALLGAELYPTGRLLQMLLCAVLVFQPKQAHDWVEQLTGMRVLLLLLLFIAALLTMFTQAFNPFLYFQF